MTVDAQEEGSYLTDRVFNSLEHIENDSLQESILNGEQIESGDSTLTSETSNYETVTDQADASAGTESDTENKSDTSLPEEPDHNAGPVTRAGRRIQRPAHLRDYKVMTPIVYNVNSLSLTNLRQKGLLIVIYCLFLCMHL